MAAAAGIKKAFGATAAPSGFERKGLTAKREAGEKAAAAAAATAAAAGDVPVEEDDDVVMVEAVVAVVVPDGLLRLLEALPSEPPASALGMIQSCAVFK